MRYPIHREQISQVAQAVVKITPGDVCFTAFFDTHTSKVAVYMAGSGDRIACSVFDTLHCNMDTGEIWDLIWKDYEEHYSADCRANFEVRCIQFDINWHFKAFGMHVFAKGRNPTSKPGAKEPHKCNCDRYTLFNFGCKCGGV
jgi:hypothetical protein